MKKNFELTAFSFRDNYCLIKYDYFLSAIRTQLSLSNNAHCTVSAQVSKMVYYGIQCNKLRNQGDCDLTTGFIINNKFD